MVSLWLWGMLHTLPSVYRDKEGILLVVSPTSISERQALGLRVPCLGLRLEVSVLHGLGNSENPQFETLKLNPISSVHGY